MDFSELEGKTITSARLLQLKHYDDRGFLRMDFSDGTHLILRGGYGGYTGSSLDEYKEEISIFDPEKYTGYEFEEDQ